MNKMTFAAAVICFSFSHASYSEEMSATGWYAASSAVVSVGSSALVSGIILSPVLLPLNLSIGSVVENKKQKTALLTTKSPDNKDIKCKFRYMSSKKATSKQVIKSLWKKRRKAPALI